MQRLASSLRLIGPDYDAVVVGSGYGGGVAAARLARAGKRVAVLERGREIPVGEFPRQFSDLRNDLQLSGRQTQLGSPTGLYDVRLGDDIHVLVGCGLGGGSLINAGVALRPDARVFQDPAWPSELARDPLLEEGYLEARRWLRPARDPAAHERSKWKALDAASVGLGVEPVAAPVTVNFIESVNLAGIAQPACTLCGDCCGGCNVGAKNTVALTYLPDAVRHGAQIFTHAKVGHLAQDRRSGCWRVHFEVQPGADAAGVDAAGSVSAALVVLAAGTLGSTEISCARANAGSPFPIAWVTDFPPMAISLPSVGGASCRLLALASAIPPRSRTPWSAPPFPARSKSSIPPTSPTA